MIERCHFAASEIKALDIINRNTVEKAVSNMGSLRVERLLITDDKGVTIYDSSEGSNGVSSAILPDEVKQALNGNDVFTSRFDNGIMRSNAATPIMSYGTLLGCVYMTEYDVSQGALIGSLQNNILTITICLEIAIILFSLLISRAFSAKIDNLIASMHIIREGDYSKPVKIKGNDEISILGEEFNELRSRLEAMDATRRQFVSNASHELKTPLASIKLLSDSILQNDMDAETVREFVEDIGNEADRLNRMSQKLLSLSKADAKVIEPAQVICIDETAQRVVRMLTPLAQIRNIHIETSFADSCPILSNEDDLYQILFNLIENGIKYNKENGNLYIRLNRIENTAVLKIKDEGAGIPEESIPQIFDRFYRVDKARSRSTGGSGLGLSIVRDLIQKHHGRISVESAVGYGSVFTLYFPIFCGDPGQNPTSH
ncbi:MAG: HAMP domain-containing protein [Ruminococcaceae bacterium]|nr:HAMP domain-containing protein [Oscillospiraceae bacterium]